MTPPDAVIAGRDPVVELLQATRSDYRGLYYRWEQEQWQAGAIDFGSDAEQWPTLDHELRRLVAGAVAWRHLRARQATMVLVPFVDAAPDEEQQVFLTTELVDEARHVVLFDRFATDVLGLEADTVASRAPDVEDGALRELLLDVVPEVSRTLAALAIPDLAALVSATSVYQLGIVGVVDLTEQRVLTEYLRSQEVLPGLLKALHLTMRDAARHTAFGMRLLEEGATSAAVVGGRDALENVAPLLERGLRERSGGYGVPSKSVDMRKAAQTSCAAWFEAVGIEPPLLSRG